MFLIGRWEQPKVAKMCIVRRCDRASELGYKARGRPNKGSLVQLNPRPSASAALYRHGTATVTPFRRTYRILAWAVGTGQCFATNWQWLWTWPVEIEVRPVPKAPSRPAAGLKAGEIHWGPADIAGENRNRPRKRSPGISIGRLE
jgi:hypothetical protein